MKSFEDIGNAIYMLQFGLVYNINKDKQTMNSSRSKYLSFLFFANFILMILFISTSYAQPSNPPLPDEEWNPPLEGSTGGQSHYEMAGWSTVHELTVWTADIDGNPKNQFNLDEKVYLYVDTPIQWIDNFMWMHEYHQTNMSSGSWRFWKVEIGFGRFMFGPFSPNKYQPSGNYTWKVWVLEPESGEYQSKVINFTYTTVIPEFPKFSIGIILFLLSSFLILLKRMRKKILY